MIEGAQTYLRGMGTPVKVTELQPLPIDDHFFAERVHANTGDGVGGPGYGGSGAAIDGDLSAKMVRALREAELLDERGFLKEDPRASDWRRALAPLAKDDGLQPDKSALGEVLNVAYALHELSADRFEEDVAWLEARAEEATAARLGGVGFSGGEATGATAAATPRRAAAGTAV